MESLPTPPVDELDPHLVALLDVVPRGMRSAIFFASPTAAARTLAEHLGDAPVLGDDPSAWPDDARGLPLAIVVGALERVADPVAALAEVRRRVAADGSILVVAQRARPALEPRPGARRLWSEERLRAVITEAGLRVADDEVAGDVSCWIAAAVPSADAALADAIAEARRALATGDVDAATRALADSSACCTEHATLVELALVSGSCLLARGLTADASVAFAEALDLAPRSARARVGLAAVAMVEGELERSERLLRAALERDPTATDALRGLGILMRARGDEEGARDALESAAIVGAGDPAAVAAFVELLIARGETREAIDRLDDLLSRVPEHMPMRLARAWACLSIGRRDEARSELAILVRGGCADHEDVGQLERALETASTGLGMASASATA